jgi:hypothetical protein
MRFFNIDQHISVIADLKKIFGDMGHTIDDICLSGHAPIMGRKQDSVPMLDGNNWCGFVQRKAWDEFFETYTELETYDAFLCCYPPIFSYLYRRYTRPIIIDIPIRYEYPCQSSAEDWKDFNSYLQEGVDRKKIYLVANNIYDKLYTEAFIDRPVEWIPSLCEYTGAQYAPKRTEFLVYSAKPFDEFNGTMFKHKNSTLPFGHAWQTIADYSGVVHFPYNVSTMSTFEHYTANIPIFCPSLDFLIELYKKGKEYRVLEQTSWNSTFGRPAGSVICMQDTLIAKMGDPNDFNNIEVIKNWMQHSDYYHLMSMPHIIYFDSFEDLIYKALHTDLQTVSDNMKKFNAEKKQQTYLKWNNLIKRVQNDRSM